MKLDVVIPTYQRQEKLFRGIESIVIARKECHTIEVILHIYFSIKKDMEECIGMQAKKDWIKYHLLTEEFKASTFWNDHLRTMEADALCYLTDDVELDKDCLINGWESLSDVEFDGVVGFKMSNATDGQPCEAAFGMLGRKYAERFPARDVFCPEYWCFFCDSELEEYAKSIDKFYFNKQAILQHAHPSFTNEKPDATHTWHRRHSMEDHAVRNFRKKKKILWGRSYFLVGGKV